MHGGASDLSSAGRVEVDRKADVAPGPFASTTRPQASGHPSQEDGTWWGVLCLLSALGLCGTLVVGRPEGDGTDTAQVDAEKKGTAIPSCRTMGRVVSFPKTF